MDVHLSPFHYPRASLELNLPQTEYERLIAAGLRLAAQVTYAEPDQGELERIIPWLRHEALALAPTRSNALEALKESAVLPMRQCEPGRVTAQLLALALYLRAEHPDVAAHCLAQAAGLFIQQLRPKARARRAAVRLALMRHEPSWLVSLDLGDDSVLAALRLVGLLLSTPSPEAELLNLHLTALLPDGLDTLSADETALGRAALLRYGGPTSVDQLLSLTLRSTIDTTPNQGDVLALLLVLGDLRDQVRAA